MCDELITYGVAAIVAEARKTKETAERMANGDAPRARPTTSASTPGWCISSPSKWSVS